MKLYTHYPRILDFLYYVSVSSQSNLAKAVIKKLQHSYKAFKDKYHL